jgi:SAM-dependent methyltransferase
MGLSDNVSKERADMISSYNNHAANPQPDPLDPSYQMFKDLGLPADIFEASCGGGCPLSFAPVPLDSKCVVDLGCGAGHDVVIAAKMVGSSGHVVGVDLTAGMLERAHQNAVRCEVADRTSFVEGAFDTFFEPDIPSGLSEGRADLVISNGAFNLAVDKPAVSYDFEQTYGNSSPSPF